MGSLRFGFIYGHFCRFNNENVVFFIAGGTGYLDLIDSRSLAESLLLYLEVVDCIERDVTYMNTQPMGEPQLGKRGLYRSLGGFQDIEDAKLAMLWLLNQCDGTKSLLDIAERSGLSWDMLGDASQVLVEHGLLEVVSS